MVRSGDWVLRTLANAWTILFFGFLVWNFFSLNSYDYLVAPFSAIYTAVLGMYVGTKEFERWHAMYDGKRHPGELFVFFWTVLMIFFVSASFKLGAEYAIPSEIVAVYIMVLSVFMLTERSKKLYANKKKRK